MRQDVFHRRAERADAVRLADPVGMQRDAHHAALFGAFLVHRVEVVADLAARNRPPPRPRRCRITSLMSTEYGIESSFPVFTFSGNGWSS